MVGVESNPAAAAIARPYYDQVVVEDVEQALFHALQGCRFDVIVCADILEHLKSPASVLERLKGFLSDKGVFVVSVPNVAFASIRLCLLLGLFSYNKAGGIMDAEHLKFFTRRSLVDTLEEAGLAVTAIRGYNLVRRRYWFLKILGWFWPTLFCLQFCSESESSEMRPAMKVSVVMPLRNAAHTVAGTLRSLVQQNTAIHELIVVDDASTDESVSVVRSVLDGTQLPFVLVQHAKSLGLAQSYNDGISRSSGDLIVTLHSDVVIQGAGALEQLVGPFLLNDKVLATYHYVDHPLELWKTYNFWQKCFFARQLGVRQRGLDGKFDCFRRTALEAAGMFDGQTFRRAGEDGDIVRKLLTRGEVLGTDAGILHLHSRDPHFSMQHIIYKHAQYAESQGAIYRRYGCGSLTETVRAFFREILVVMLLIPWIRIPGAVVIMVYAFAYSHKLYAREWRDPRIVFVPFLNILLLFVSCIFSVRGFLRGRQTL